MKKKTTDAVKIYAAIGMLFSGVGLMVAGFIVEPLGAITDSVLWASAQCLMWAGGALGLDYFVDWKINKSINNENK